MDLAIQICLLRSTFGNHINGPACALLHGIETGCAAVVWPTEQKTQVPMQIGDGTGLIIFQKEKLPCRHNFPRKPDFLSNVVHILTEFSVNQKCKNICVSINC